MKLLFRGMLAFAIVGILIGSMAFASDQDRSGLIRREIQLTASGNIGCVEVGAVKDSLQLAASSRAFSLPATDSKFGYFLSVYCVDTVAGAADIDDSLLFRLVRSPDGIAAEAAVSTDLTDGAEWVTVYSFAITTAWATTFPLTKHIPLDSTAVYPIGPGFYKWIVVGGALAADHYPSKAFKFACYVEFDANEAGN